MESHIQLADKTKSLHKIDYSNHSNSRMKVCIVKNRIQQWKAPSQITVI